MTIDPTLFVAAVNIIAGLLILLIPSMLRILVGGYLLLVGIIWLVAYLL